MTGRADAREKMLESAIVLQRQRGVADVSVADVLAHSGAPRGSVYHHFPDGRDQLAAEATARAAEAMVSALTAVVHDNDLVAAARLFLDAWFGSMTLDGQELGCPLAAAALTASDSPARVEAGHGFAALASVLETALTTQGVASDDAATLATVALAAAEGALILARAGDDRALERVADFIVDQISRAVT